MTPRLIPAVVTLLVLVGCGGGGSTPTAPATSPPPPLQAPDTLNARAHQVTMTSNIVTIAWNSAAVTHRLVIGSGPGLQDVLVANVVGASYEWNAPGTAALYYIQVFATNGENVSAPSSTMQLTTIDLRHVIDAMFFRSGPLADEPETALGNPAAGVWPDGTRVRVVISETVGTGARSFGERFLQDYAALTFGGVTGSISMTAEDFLNLTLGQVEPFDVPVRVRAAFCGANAVACAYYAPPPLGANRSIVTFANDGQNALRAMAHELGHVYGLGHVRAPLGSATQATAFMMNPSLLSDAFTSTEMAAITAARAGGLSPFWRREQALAAGLVQPFTSSTLTAAVALLKPDRSRDLCHTQVTPRLPSTPQR